MQKDTRMIDLKDTYLKKIKYPNGSYGSVTKFKYKPQVSEIFKTMPVLDNWPLRQSEPYDPDKSEIYTWIKNNLMVDDNSDCTCLMQFARSKGLIVYNRETKKWNGTGNIVYPKTLIEYMKSEQKTT